MLSDFCLTTAYIFSVFAQGGGWLKMGSYLMSVTGRTEGVVEPPALERRAARERLFRLQV